MQPWDLIFTEPPRPREGERERVLRGARQASRAHVRVNICPGESCRVVLIGAIFARVEVSASDGHQRNRDVEEVFWQPAVQERRRLP